MGTQAAPKRGRVTPKQDELNKEINIEKGILAHDRRPNEVIRTVKTLDQLTEALNLERI